MAKIYDAEVVTQVGEGVAKSKGKGIGGKILAVGGLLLLGLGGLFAYGKNKQKQTNAEVNEADYVVVDENSEQE